MNITEYKLPYQDMSALFGVRNGKLYSGHIAVDGTPVDNYGVLYQGLGTAREKALLSLGPYLALPGAATTYTLVEAPVMQRNPRAAYPTQLMWGFDAVKGIEDKNPSKMRGTTIQTLDTGELIYVPRYPNGAQDASIGQAPYMGVRYNDRISTQFYPYSTATGSASMGLSFKYATGGHITNMVADVIPLEGTSRFASLTYAATTGYNGQPFELHTFKVFDLSVAGAFTEVGKVMINNSNDQSRAHPGYGIPLDESLIERDVNGNAIAYHLVYGKYQVAGETIPGKLLYKRIGLRPWSEPAQETELMNITTGTWPSIPTSAEGDCVVKIEGRAFTYTHDGVKYLVVFCKMGRHSVTNFTPIPFTVKRAVLTDGIAGPFETITFPVPFSNYGTALLLSPNRKTMWHYPYNGVKVACLSFGASVTLDSQDINRDTYIAAAGVDNDQFLFRTDGNSKFIARPGSAMPAVSLAFDKPAYALGATAILTVTTVSATPVTVNLQVSGASVKEHTVTVQTGTPATISLTVTGLLQATMVD